MGWLCYNAYSFSILIQYHPSQSAGFNRNQTLPIVYFITPLPIAHSLAVDSVVAFVDTFPLYILSEICASFPCSSNLCQLFYSCWLLPVSSVFFLPKFSFLLRKNIVFDRDPGSQNPLFGLLRLRLLPVTIVLRIVWNIESIFRKLFYSFRNLYPYNLCDFAVGAKKLIGASVCQKIY